MFLLFCISQIITISTCLYTFFNWDQQKKSSDKLYPYTDMTWIIWRESLINSLQNSVLNLVALKNILNWTPGIFTENNNTLIHLGVFYLISETYFYFTHRLLHRWYSMHKLHHSTINTVASSFYDTTVIEHIVLNMGTIFIPVIMLGISKFEFFIIYNIGIINACISHSGYKNYSDKHFLHHKLFNKNYGFGLFIWDRILGTYQKN